MPTTRDLSIKWTVSRGRNTYGYNVVTLRERGEKKAQCKGGGYDMTGTVFGDWLEGEFQDRLVKADVSKLYGARKVDGAIRLDGGCGFSCMESIANAIGVHVRIINSGRNDQVITVTDTVDA